MGRIRTIKPEFFTSETIAQLSFRARLTFVGLWTYCDDYGRCRDNAQLIKAAVWPLDGVTIGQLTADLDDLAKHQLIDRYEVDGRTYLAVPSWDEHQSAAYRRGEPKYPPPPARTTTRANCIPPVANRMADRAGTGNREQGTGKPTAVPFDAFWAEYPRKVGKPKAVAAFKASLSRADVGKIMAGLRSWLPYWAATEQKFIPHPTSWLNRDGWDDEPPSPNGHSADVPDFLRSGPRR